MTAIRATEKISPSKAPDRGQATGPVLRARPDSVSISQPGAVPAGWTEVKVPAGATLESLTLGATGMADEIAERNLGRPDWTVEVKNRPDGPLGWFIGLFGVPRTRKEPKYGPGDSLPEGATMLLPRDLDPNAAAPPGFKRIALPAGNTSIAALTGGDQSWADAIAKANPDLTPDRIARGALYLNLPDDLPVEKGLPVPPAAAERAGREAVDKLAQHIGHDNLGRELDAARGLLKVKPGDTLAGLAKLVFNDATRWAELKPPHDPEVGPGDDLAARGRTYVPLPGAYAAPDWGDVKPLEPEHPFLKKLAPAAARIQEEFGIPAEVILAQAALESGMGSSKIGDYNVFGIKGSGSRGSVLVPTFEYSGGRRIQTQAHFADFGSWDEALREHAEILRKPVFTKAMSHKDDPVAFAHALTGKYATDPRYGEKLVETMREQNLLDI